MDVTSIAFLAFLGGIITNEFAFKGFQIFLPVRMFRSMDKTNTPIILGWNSRNSRTTGEKVPDCQGETSRMRLETSLGLPGRNTPMRLETLLPYLHFA